MCNNLSAKQVAVGYFAQLSDGCDHIACNNDFCRSCKSFCFPDLDTKEKQAKKMLELLKQYSAAKLCKWLPPSVFNPEIMTKAQAFNNLIADLKAEKEIDSEAAKTVIKNVVSDPEIFVNVFKVQTKGKLGIDNEMMEEMTTMMHKNFQLFLPFKPDFEAMVKSFITEESETLRHIRGLMIMGYFDLFLIGSEVSMTAVELCNHINALTEKSATLFKEQMASNSEALLHLAGVFQSNLSVYSMQYIHESEKTTKTRVAQEALHSAVPRSLAIGINILRNCAAISAHPLPSERFVNEVISSCLDPGWDLIQFVKHGEQGVDHYVNIPAVLDLRYKGLILKLFNDIQQQEEMNQILHRRLFAMAPISRRDLQLYIEVTRSNIIHDALAVLSRTQDRDLMKKLMIVFQGEQGVDAGGVSREFFYLFCNEAFSPDYGMFKKISGGKYWFHNTYENGIHFVTLGTVVALAVYNFIILPIRFPRVLYKKLRGKKLELSDLSEIDEELAQSFITLRQCKSDGMDIEDMELTFTVTVDNFGVAKVIPLKEGGEDIIVTNDTLEEYIELYSDYILNKSVEDQFGKFKRGFMKLCNHPIFQMFAEDEMDILVSGVEVLDWSELEEYAEYSDGYNRSSQEVKWFWEIFYEFTDEQKEKFLRFSTGSDRTPIGGLKDVKLTIQRTGDPTKLPVSHTCFNIFSLPNYDSKEVMREKVLIAIENNEGFGLI